MGVSEDYIPPNQYFIFLKVFKSFFLSKYLVKRMVTPSKEGEISLQEHFEMKGRGGLRSFYYFSKGRAVDLNRNKGSYILDWGNKGGDRGTMTPPLKIAFPTSVPHYKKFYLHAYFFQLRLYHFNYTEFLSNCRACVAGSH